MTNIQTTSCFFLLTVLQVQPTDINGISSITDGNHALPLKIIVNPFYGFPIKLITSYIKI
jgi:hypothetical protein